MVLHGNYYSEPGSTDLAVSNAANALSQAVVDQVYPD